MLRMTGLTIRIFMFIQVIIFWAFTGNAKRISDSKLVSLVLCEIEVIPQPLNNTQSLTTKLVTVKWLPQNIGSYNTAVFILMWKHNFVFVFLSSMPPSSLKGGSPRSPKLQKYDLQQSHVQSHWYHACNYFVLYIYCYCKLTVVQLNLLYNYY
jgi:hypothetical protein